MTAPTVFISYSHKDKDYVQRLYQALNTEGFDVWIDDRIDYGREWPKVIQDNLDASAAFLVVMSKNSFESEMVQNEVARAREKKKPVFTLLLDGENWLIFQAKQYVDVSGGTLPPEQFYSNLEKHVGRQEIYDPIRFLPSTDYWTPYQNNAYKFSFRFPLEGEKVIDEPEKARINFPKVPGTNLHAKYITVNISEGGHCANLLTKEWFDETASMVNRRKIRIGDLVFLREIGNDAGMSKLGEWVSYSIARKEICVSLTINTIVVGDGPYYHRMVPKIDVDASRELILLVATTFEWFD